MKVLKAENISISFDDKKICDIGTGAGFPGMVLSIFDESIECSSFV